MKKMIMLAVAASVLPCLAYAGGTGEAIACKYVIPYQGVNFDCNGASSALAGGPGAEKTAKAGDGQCDTVTKKVNGVNVTVNCGKVAVNAPE